MASRISVACAVFVFLTALLLQFAIAAPQSSGLIYLSVRDQPAAFGGRLTASFAEIERQPGYSIVELELQSAKSSAWSLFTLDGYCKVLQARRAAYVQAEELSASHSGKEHQASADAPICYRIRLVFPESGNFSPDEHNGKKIMPPFSADECQNVFNAIAGKRDELVSIVVNNEPVENGKKLNAHFRETERKPGYSMVESVVSSSGSASSALSPFRGICAVMRARDARVVRLSLPPPQETGGGKLKLRLTFPDQEGDNPEDEMEITRDMCDVQYPF